MSEKYQIEVLLRPAVEWYAGFVTVMMALVLVLAPAVFYMPPVIAQAAAGFLLIVAIRDFYLGYRVIRYRRGMSRAKTRVMRTDAIPVHEDRLYLGHGFEWEQRHTQRYVDTLESRYRPYLYRTREYHWVRAVEKWLQHVPVLKALACFTRSGSRLNPWPPKSQLGGDVSIDGVEERQAPVTLRSSDRKQHALVLGTTGAGKTDLLETLVAQDIRRHSRDPVIVFDPKGSADLLKTMMAECRRAGRLDDLVVFHLGYPSISAMYNAVGNYTRITEVSSRLANQLPSEGDSAAFQQFCWRFMNLVVRAAEKLGVEITLKTVKRHIGDFADLYHDYAMHLLQKNNYDGWQEAYEKSRASTAYTAGARLPPFLSARSETVRALYKLMEDHDHFGLQSDVIYQDLLEVFRMPPDYYIKLVSQVGPLIDKLTAGQLETLMCPSEAELKKGRKLLDWEQVIRRRSVVYVGLDAMSDFFVASATGSAMLGDMVSVASRIYKHGVYGNVPGDHDATDIWLHLDEVYELIGDEFIPMINKVRGAGFAVTAYSQTAQDFEQALGNKAKQQIVLGNFNNLIMLRVRNTETAEILTSQCPEVQTLRLINITSVTDTDNMFEDSLFRSTNEDRALTETVPMITPSMVMKLPIGQAFASIEGSRILKITVPKRDRAADAVEGPIETIMQDMHRKYRGGSDWFMERIYHSGRLK